MHNFPFKCQIIQRKIFEVKKLFSSRNKNIWSGQVQGQVQIHVPSMLILSVFCNQIQDRLNRTRFSSWINQGGLIFVEWFPHYFKLLTCLTPTPSVPNLTGLTEPTLSWEIKIIIFFQIEIFNCWYEPNVKDKEGLIREIINLVTGDSYMWQPRCVPPICHYCNLEVFRMFSRF